MNPHVRLFVGLLYGLSVGSKDNRIISVKIKVQSIQKSLLDLIAIFVVRRQLTEQ